MKKTYMNLGRFITPTALIIIHVIVMVLCGLALIGGIWYGIKIHNPYIAVGTLFLAPILYILLRMYIELGVILFKIEANMEE